MASEKTIILSGDPVRKEVDGAAVITPGEILEFDSNGDVQQHSTVGGNFLPMVAVEEDMLGNEIGDTYASGDRVQIAVLGKGNIFNGLLNLGENVSKGDPLESNGDGTLRAHTPDAVDSNQELAGGTTIYHQGIVGYAWEDVDNSAGSSSARIAVLVA